MPISVQHTERLPSGNSAVIFIDDLGEVKINYSRNPSKQDKQLAEAVIPQAMAEYGALDRDRMRPEPQPQQESEE